MIEVILYRNDETEARIEAPDPESAVLGARTIWDDSLDRQHVQGCTRAMRLVFIVNGKCVRMIEGRRP